MAGQEVRPHRIGHNDTHNSVVPVLCAEQAPHQQAPSYGDARAACSAAAQREEISDYHGHAGRPLRSSSGTRQGRPPLASLLLLFLLPAIIAAVSGCSGALGPGETVLAVYEAANEGDLEKLESYYSEGLAEGMEGPIGELTGGTPGFADHLARGGIIEDVEVLDVQESGDTADVDVWVTYNKAELEERNEGDLFAEDNPVKQGLPLVNDNGSWKVSVDYLSEGE